MPGLGTKLHVPSPRHRLVTRRRLTERLRGDASSRPRLVLLAAPAGFGKTTLLAQWLAAPSDPTEAATTTRVAWLSLDPADAGPRRFLRHLLAALQEAEPEIGREAAAMLGTDRDIPSEEFVGSLLNDLDSLAGPTVIVLDDYHLIDAVAVHQAVRFLVDNLPPQVTVAMTTRADPPLPQARLRARGELLEIRAADLRFTEAEAAAFLNEVMGLHLGAEHVAALGARTEGWAAGLQLAAIAARTHTTAEELDVDAFIDAFTGSHRFVLDYLVQDVLDGQPAEVRSFLLDTSVLDHMTESLCDAVTGRGDGHRMLETLERANLFLVPLDHERHWYRYHHLFSEALRARLHARDPGRVQQLHRLAADWYCEHGQLDAAFAHALAGGDDEQTADMVELALPELRRRRETHLLSDRLKSLSDDVVRRRPMLAAHYAWLGLSDGDLDGAERWLDAAEVLLDKEHGRTTPVIGATTTRMAEAVQARDEDIMALPAQLAVYRAAVAQARGDVEATASHARRALGLARAGDHLARSGGAGFLALAAWAAGDLATATDTFSETVRSLHAAGNVADELGTTVPLADMWFGRGRPDRARRLYEAALEAAGHQASHSLVPTGDLHVGLANVLREQGDLESAEHHLRVAKELGDRASFLENRYRWYTAMAALLRARGDLDAAVRTLDAAESRYLPGFFPEVQPIAAARARIWIAQGRLADARTWADEQPVGLDDEPAFLAEFAHLTLIRLRLAEHRAGTRDGLDEVTGLLERIGTAADAAGRQGSLVETSLLRALVQHACGDLDRAVQHLGRVLRLGVPHGYRRLFLDEGVPVLELLRVAADTLDSSAAGHAASLLRVVEQSPEPDPERRAGALPDGTSGGYDEKLSDRELEVLRLLAGELTGPEIADRLFVSVNTLRTHTRHIFTKLDVNTRRAAVRRATDLGLL
ncbi:MAG TPA: LuxR C-terminal-related transcriptional regulator [Marmoricola sp.]|nr:LuxR C-terminal-related transcriptional regulator [Marmoricola sp.]